MSSDPPYQARDANSWDEAKDLLRCLSPAWIYRGLRVSEWGFETSFDRMIRLPRAKLHGIHKDVELASKRTEDNLVDNFRNRVTPYLTSDIRPRNKLEWLAFMQHYGAPTRLLDFSFSPYIAAFFALRGRRDSDRCAVWALHSYHFARETVRHFLEGHPELGEKFPSLQAALTNSGTLPNLGEDEFFEDFVMAHEWKGILPLWSHGVDPRMRRQHGLFVLPCDVSVSASENFLSFDKEFLNRNLIKITISNQYLLEGMADLEYMGITEETMFPGLEGAVRHFNVEQEMKLKFSGFAHHRRIAKARKNNMPTY